jgi:hypothetical protein
MKLLPLCIKPPCRLQETACPGLLAVSLPGELHSPLLGPVLFYLTEV